MFEGLERLANSVNGLFNSGEISRRALLASIPVLLGIAACDSTSKKSHQEHPAIERNPVPAFVKKEFTRAGKLYFHVSTDYLSPEEMDFVAEDVRKNFEQAEIIFEDVKVIRGNTFPDLQPLDILIYVLDGDVLNSLQPLTISGQFGVGIRKGHSDYYDIKSKLKIPYSIELSSVNTGYVAISLSPDDIDGNIYLKVLNGLDEDEIVRLVSHIITHETAHGLGAAHISSVLCNDCNYFMDLRAELDEATFSGKNVSEMKEYIRRIKSDKRFENPKDRADLLNICLLGLCSY